MWSPWPDAWDDFGEIEGTGDLCRAEVELGAVTALDGCAAAALLLGREVNPSPATRVAVPP